MIPAFEVGAWYLPQGIHPATLAEVEERFVASAPFPERRQIIFDAFTAWHKIVSGLLPEARFWIDGGFVTHKAWAPPSDVDVTVMAKPVELNSLSSSDKALLPPLFTDEGPPIRRPMSNMVDSYLCVRGLVERTLYWREHWSTIVDEDHSELPGIRKGFLEVRA